MNPSLLIISNYDMVVARRFLVRIAGLLHRSERKSLKARMHETKGIFVNFYVRSYSHQQMFLGRLVCCLYIGFRHISTSWLGTLIA